MIWLAIALLTATVVYVVTRPLSRTAAAQPCADPDVALYRQQLEELDREVERSALSGEEAAQTRVELARRLLRANRSYAKAEPGLSAAHLSPAHASAALALFIIGGSLSLYLWLGSPGLPDQPLEARLNAPIDKQPIEIQIANVERRLRDNPKDGRGWAVIAPVYLRLELFDKAVDAFRRAIALQGESEERLIGLGEALTFGNGGAISDEAKEAFARALERNPKSVGGRFWLALLAEQEGRKEEARQAYRALLSEKIPEHLTKALSERLASLDEYGSTGAQEATGSAAGGEQGAMIRGMVEQLATRLKENGADLDGWLKLIRSYAVLKETAKEEEALASARKQFEADPEALGKINALARSFGPQSSEGAQRQ